MRIGMIGCDETTASASWILLDSGHSLAISDLTAPERAADLSRRLNGNAVATDVGEAARFGEIVFVAISAEQRAQLSAVDFTGKVIIDATDFPVWKPVRKRLPAELPLTGTELLAALLPGAFVVRVFNFSAFAKAAYRGDVTLPVQNRQPIYIAGDSLDAKRRVSNLIEEIGFRAADIGSLCEGSRFKIDEAKIVYSCGNTSPTV
jgi:predicted dinucleotide-binding enzyme